MGRPSGFSRKCPRELSPIVALGAAALGMFVWSHIGVYMLAELVTGVVAVGAFLLTHPGALPAEAAPGQALASGRTAAAGSRP